MDELVVEQRGLRFSLCQVERGHERFMVERVSDGHILASVLLVPQARDRFDEVIDAWIDERLGVGEPAPVHCASCDVRLEPEGRMDTDYQFDNALWVTFSGGYGMFIDRFDEPEPKAVLCHECAHRLCELFPWVDRLLRPSTGHSHRRDRCVDLILEGHVGWDLEPTRIDEGPELARHLTVDHGVADLPESGRAQWALHYDLHDRDRSLGHTHPAGFVSD